MFCVHVSIINYSITYLLLQLLQRSTCLSASRRHLPTRRVRRSCSRFLSLATPNPVCNGCVTTKPCLDVDSTSTSQSATPSSPSRGRRKRTLVPGGCPWKTTLEVTLLLSKYRSTVGVLLFDLEVHLCIILVIDWRFIYVSG